MWAPGRIPAGTECHALASTIDLLPTIAAIIGTPLLPDRVIDGMDITALLKGTAESVRQEFLYYSQNGRIDGIRKGDWKLLETIKATRNPQEAAPNPDVMLYNLAADVAEKNNLAAERPEIVAQLRQRMHELDAALETGARPAWKKTGT
jgi:arylsulfatase A-like enzyme